MKHQKLVFGEQRKEEIERITGVETEEVKIDSFEDKKITKSEGCVQRRFLNVKTVKLKHHSFESRVTAARVKLSGSQRIMQSLQHKDHRQDL